LLLLQAGIIACVLAALPYPLFDLDRHAVPKELALHLAAGGAAFLCLRSARRLQLAAVDLLLLGFLGLGALSALLATNPWLALRSLGVSLSGAALFWTARSITRAGHGRALLLAVIGAAVLGAITALLQAYGMASTFASVSRAPGGTFGNRNFMAHATAIALPALMLVTLQTRSRGGVLAGQLAVGLMTAALVLSRSRAAWLGVIACLTFMVVEGIWLGRLHEDAELRPKLRGLGLAAAVGLVAALALPNQLAWNSSSPYLDSLRGVANYKEGSGRGRLIQYRNTFAMVRDNPVLGVGPGNWAVEYPSYTTPADPSYEAASAMPTNPWPSSDWVAMLAERGVPAVLLLLGAGALVATAAWLRSRSGRRAERLPELALAGTLVTTAVVGSFDAVLLLPVPAFLVWTIIGTLAPATRPLGLRWPEARMRRVALTATAAVWLLLAGRSAAQLGAMRLYSIGRGADARELAARIDPANYRIRLWLAGAWIARGRCDLGRPHAEAARALFPLLPTPQRFLKNCRGARRA
jgi:O-antigen ligase